MNINFIDIALIVVFAACIAAGYARGFILSLISFAKLIISFPLAFLLRIITAWHSMINT